MPFADTFVVFRFFIRTHAVMYFVNFSSFWNLAYHATQLPLWKPLKTPVMCLYDFPLVGKIHTRSFVPNGDCE